MRFWHSLSVLAALSATASACASAPKDGHGLLSDARFPAGGGAVLATGLPAPVPAGLFQWCARDPDCVPAERQDGAAIFARLIAERAGRQSAADARAEMTLTPERWHELRWVNREVNAAINPVAEASGRDGDDYWDAPLGGRAAANGRVEGDCEDYALEKRARLRALGWRLDALSLAVVARAGSSMHAVLIAQTDRGDIVLDNLSDEPGPVGQSRYEWVSRQEGTSLMAWAEARVFERGVLTLAENSSSLGAEASSRLSNWRPLFSSLRASANIRDLAQSNSTVQNY
jgi:predicted transglutaminase-like cysteine proteinase